MTLPDPDEDEPLTREEWEALKERARAYVDKWRGKVAHVTVEDWRTALTRFYERLGRNGD